MGAYSIIPPKTELNDGSICVTRLQCRKAIRVSVKVAVNEHITCLYAAYRAIRVILCTRILALNSLFL